MEMNLAASASLVLQPLAGFGDGLPSGPDQQTTWNVEHGPRQIESKRLGL